ncbi:MAG: AMP-binding protein [Hyphomonas sp.]|uniref:AMP-binding protein n=1 Tax=Hyphomonas sp. TaxID=87 RepID=UPI0017CE5951|nr:AMP-binding protein [Hyphomonas sp.]MBA3066924.1 AMP-binding protein [Hyphomonas sp.]MBU3922427.1 AMP-binding protein [Alphaproteobacteria bacterium]MBU4060572.1 AMP-binding protein [Alphaproteobacteria bacterium]MBU4165840.1 AMP-binding protein [Alphaproteobacteria bacterium]
MPGGDSIAFHARLQPAKTAIVDLVRGRKWSYAELEMLVARTVSALRRKGLRRGDRLAVLARNGPEIPALHFACARIGAMIVPLNWRLAPSELVSLLADAEPKFLLGDTLLEEKGLAGTDLDTFFAKDVAGSRPARTRPLSRDLPSLILYTSGTSGRPKGALLSERNLTETAINFSLLADVTSKSVFLCDAPMFHIIGLATNVRPVLMRGGTMLISDGFRADVTLERLADPALGITHYVCVPQMAAAIRSVEGFDAAKLRGLTALVTGGAPHAPASVLEWIEDGVPLTNGYGMTEVGTVFNMPLDPEINRSKAGSVGIATDRVQTRIVDSQGQDVKDGEAGELLVRGENVAAGYWRRAEETGEAFITGRWFRTGDIAVRDTDGFHWLIDRRKDMFISGGENVYPAEIEAALADVAGVSECAVVGVTDEKWGEVGHLFWVGAGTAAGREDELRRILRERLASYKVPRYFTKLDTLPRNGAGKILKTELRKRALEGAG